MYHAVRTNETRHRGYRRVIVRSVYELSRIVLQEINEFHRLLSRLDAGRREREEEIRAGMKKTCLKFRGLASSRQNNG